jgi:hypothetical protein
VAGRIRSIEKSNNIGNQTLDLPAYSIVPHPTTLPQTPGDAAIHGEIYVVRDLYCPVP